MIGRRLRLAGALTGLVVFMVGLAYAAVPLYRAFCQATGFDGRPKRATAVQFTPIARKLRVRFDTNVRDLPWQFTAERETAEAQIGKAGMAYFRVKNTSDHPITARAVYNISPEAAAAYFIKTQCFCFSDQTLAAGQEAEFPVIFFVDPKFATDPSTTKLDEIVLSYTFFPAPPSGALTPASAPKASAEMKKVPPKVG